jgi:glycosyltransferase involved in cell wall biosynthesis
MLTWEFPPRIVGGLSTHTYYLSRSLARKDHHIQIITCDFPNVPNQQTVDGVHVLRVNSSGIMYKDFLLWTHNMNLLMIEESCKILDSTEFDLIHAHDWMVGRAASKLKSSYKLPLVTTIHSTEVGRVEAIAAANTEWIQRDYQKAIIDIEQRLLNYSDRMICCSNYMAGHIRHTFDLPASKIDVIPNGVDILRFNPDFSIRKQIMENLQQRFAMMAEGRSPNSKMVLFVGRLVQEKGVHILINAFEKLLHDRKNNSSYTLSLIIVGEGQLKQPLRREIQRIGLEKHIHFLGFVDETTLITLYSSADVLVVPSLYEPFGIVALEAMSSRTPVIVSDIGGLAEIVKEGITGLKFPVGNADSLAAAIRRILEDQSLAESLVLNAYHDRIRKYNWDLAAEMTLETYKKVPAIKDGLSTVTNSYSVEEVIPISDGGKDVDEGYYLTDQGMLQALFTLGVTKEENSKTAREISNFISIPENSAKPILGRLASQGYVSVVVLPTITNTELTSPHIRYHLTAGGINGACTGFS